MYIAYSHLYKNLLPKYVYLYTISGKKQKLNTDFYCIPFSPFEFIWPCVYYFLDIKTS